MGLSCLYVLIPLSKLLDLDPRISDISLVFVITYDF